MWVTLQKSRCRGVGLTLWHVDVLPITMPKYRKGGVFVRESVKSNTYYMLHVLFVFSGYVTSCSGNYINLIGLEIIMCSMLVLTKKGQLLQFDKK